MKSAQRQCAASPALPTAAAGPPDRRRRPLRADSAVISPFLPKRWTFRGRDLSPIIQSAVDHPRRPAKPVQESVLFTTDETIGSRADSIPPGPVKQPAHIRCLREAHWNFAMYFDPDHIGDPRYEQYELYDLVNDPLELRNMGFPDSPSYDGAKVAEMQEKLAARMAETHTTPA